MSHMEEKIRFGNPMLRNQGSNLYIYTRCRSVAKLFQLDVWDFRRRRGNAFYRARHAHGTVLARTHAGERIRSVNKDPFATALAMFVECIKAVRAVPAPVYCAHETTGARRYGGREGWDKEYRGTGRKRGTSGRIGDERCGLRPTVPLRRLNVSRGRRG